MKLLSAVVAVLGVAFLLFGTKTDPFGIKYELSSIGQGQPQVVFAASGSVVDGYQASAHTELTWVDSAPVAHLVSMNDSIRSDISASKKSCMVKNNKMIQSVDGGCKLGNL